MNKTDEFSFILKPSNHGVGVFAVHDIKKGVRLRLSGDEKGFNGDNTRMMRKEDVPEIFRGYCVYEGETFIAPPDFGAMPVGWYINHSKNPNAELEEPHHWRASRDIKAGEEILIDYNTLREPEEMREDYYSK